MVWPMRLRRDPEPPPLYDEAASHGDPSPGFDWTVSEILRYAREQSGYAIYDVADILRIRAAQIHAIEEGRFQDLPATVYALGFVRSYSELLDLDADEMVRRFKEEAAGASAKPPLVFPTPMPEGRMPGGAILMIAILLAAVAYGGWYYMSSRSTEVVERSDFVPPRFVALSERGQDTADGQQPDSPNYEPTTASAAETVLRADGPNAGVDIRPAPTPLAETVDSPGQAIGVPGFDEAAPSVDTTVETDGAAAPSPQVAATPWAPGGAQTADAVEPPPVPEETGQRAFGANEGEIVLRATAESWVQVNDARGALVMTRVLRPGDTYVVPDGAGLRLITGNAGGLDILVDGRVAPSLGGDGVVVRNISMDPQRLLNGTATAN